jgi:hypothetical protein
MADRTYGYRDFYGYRPVAPVRYTVPTVGRSRRWIGRLVVVAVAALASVLGLSGVAIADPEENHDQDLVTKLEETARGYYQAQAVLASSQQRYAEIEQNLQTAEAELARLSSHIGKVVAARYKGSSVGLLAGLISGEGTKEQLLGGAAVGEYLLLRDDAYIRQHRELVEESRKQRELLDAELAIQSKQLELLDQQKREAERALAAVGGMVTTGYGGPAIPAQPAPRNADGTLPWESCSDPDPTSGGCITPRTYHMLTEARLAGFTRYVACWRAATWGEHPAGRACDFSAFPYGFVAQAATGEEKEYGDRLAAWAVTNAYALGVLYVIWYRQIWMPGTGWRAYNSYGDPATEHTNHVHISMY